MGAHDLFFPQSGARVGSGKISRCEAMNESGQPAIGIDVGGERKGFHAVVLRGGEFASKRLFKVSEVVDWCLGHGAKAIAVDAPCAWAVAGHSRFAERSLAIGGQTIQCFKTPTQRHSVGRSFYGWVLNGAKLYEGLAPHYDLFDDTAQNGKIVIETFPHAIACALSGKVVAARPKATTRRRILRDQGLDDESLANIDFVDAALCALTAERFLLRRVRWFGDKHEGFIVVPN
jgi:predicted RNase H-like nuclease